MNPDEGTGGEACLEARRLFSRALEDPEAEKAILRHASACLECMDAWLELQDTVKKLEAAASEIPETGDFSTRVLEAIERETHARRRRFRLTLAAGAGFLGGLGVAFVALTLLLGGAIGSKTGPADTPPGTGTTGLNDPTGVDAPKAEGPEKETPQAVSGQTNGENEGEDLPGDENEEKPVPEKVRELFETVREMEREAMEGSRHGRGRRGARFRDIVTAASALDSGDLALLIGKLKKDEFYPVFGPRNRMREELIARLEALQEKKLRRGDGGGR
jgi:hypothetical protein